MRGCESLVMERPIIVSMNSPLPKEPEMGGSVSPDNDDNCAAVTGERELVVVHSSSSS